MVGSDEFSIVRGLEKWKLSHPAEPPLVLRDQVQLVRHVQAQGTQVGIAEFLGTDLEEQQIALASPGRLVDVGAQFGGKRLEW